MNLHKYLAVSLVPLFLAACSPEQKEASKLGFTNTDEMHDIQAQGWHTKSQYLIDETARAKPGLADFDEMQSARKAGYADKTSWDKHLAAQSANERQAVGNSGEVKPVASAGADTSTGSTSAVGDAGGGAPKAKEHVDEDPFPYIAVISCGIRGFENINHLACFAGDVSTELEVTNNGQYGMYKAYSIPRNWPVTNRGLEIPLSEHFEIKAQNSQEHLLLGVRVFDKKGNVLFQKQASRFDVIDISN